MKTDTSFDATPYGRAFLQVIQILLEHERSNGQSSKIENTWVLALRIFVLAKEGQNAVDLQFGNNRSEETFATKVAALFVGNDEGNDFALPTPAILERIVVILVTVLLTRGGERDNWDFSDSFWFLPKNSSSIGVSPETADLMASVFGSVKGKYISCLFDGSHQIACRFARKGANVVFSTENAVLRNAVLLLNQLHNTSIRLVEFTAIQGDATYDIGVAVPAFGTREIPRQYAIAPLSDIDFWPGHSHRLELLTIRLMWQQIKGKCAILVSPNVLFSTGQEQRFREHLVFQLNAVEAVIALPQRQVMSTNIAAGILILNRHMKHPTIRFVDAGTSVGTDRDGRVGIRIKSSQMMAALARREQENPIFACDVSREDLPKSDVSLHPPRYVGSFSLSGEKVKLSDLVETLVRPPAKPTGVDETQAMEINISDLHAWGYVTQTDKQAAVRQTKLSTNRLRDDDIILSIKGSLAKVGIFHSNNTALIEPVGVVSQSCVGLRLSVAGRNIISPIALYMYLRSANGKMALEALNVGAAIPHIQPTALLDQLQVPILTPMQKKALENDFSKMMDLQREIKDKQTALNALAGTYWSELSEQK